jgi:hypothetical protein
MTIEQLQALPDKELNALAAKLRGLKAFNFQGVKWLGVTDAQGKTHGKHKLREWTPTTSRDQSGELLEWAAGRGILFDVAFGHYASDERHPHVEAYLPRYDDKAWISENRWLYHIPGNDARAQTVAFCAAMLAIQGESK